MLTLEFSGLFPCVKLFFEDLLEFTFSSFVLCVGFALEKVGRFIPSESGMAFALRQVATVQVLQRVRVFGQLFPVGIHAGLVAHRLFSGSGFCEN